MEREPQRGRVAAREANGGCLKRNEGKSVFIVQRTVLLVTRKRYLYNKSQTSSHGLQDLSGSLATDASSELHVLGHDGNSLGVDGAQVGVLEEANHVSLSGLLESKDGRGLEAEVSLEVVGNLTDKSLEGELADEELSGLLEAADLAEGDSAGLEAVGSLDAGGGTTRGLALGGLVSDGLSGVLGTGSLAGGVLGSGHFIINKDSPNQFKLGP